MTTYFRKTVTIPRPVDDVFAWHERPGAFERLAPPWQRIEVESRAGGIRDGAHVHLRTKVGPFWSRWEVKHHDYVENVRFRDKAQRSPFSSWEHLHAFRTAEGGNGSVLTDEIRYTLPGGWAGRLAGGGFAKKELERLFHYRHAVTRADLEFAGRHAARPRMRVAVTGSTGLIGRALVAMLTTQGHEVVRLVRRKPQTDDEVFWDPDTQRLDPAHLGVLDAVVHLAGESVAGGRWTEARKELIRKSRVDGTALLVRALRQLPVPPLVLVSGSGAGYYGDTGDEAQDERGAAGAGFLASVCMAWEREALALRDAGTRCVVLRTGMVLSPAGGALAKLLPPFSLGVGGRLGSGEQWMSWISIDDMAAGILHALHEPGCDGPLNLVAPTPVRNAEFTRTLGRVLRRPTVLPVPMRVLRMALGEMADEALLASSRVVPTGLMATGYDFRHKTLESALRHGLGRADCEHETP